MSLLGAVIEESEQGAWIADIETTEEYAESFILGGVTWVGVAISSTQEGGRFRTRVVGGKGGLSTVIGDRYYLGGGSGNTIVSDIAMLVGETAAPLLPARVASWQRQRGTAGQALDELVKTLGAVWYVSRGGVLVAEPSRASGSVDLRKAVRVGSDVDGSILYATDSAAEFVPGLSIDGQVIRHIRWKLTKTRLSAEVSFIPFQLTDLRGGLDYLRTHRAVVEKQNANGSLDLIVGNRFSLTQIPWLAGIPADIVIEPGDVVTAASWGGDPRQWFAFGLDRKTGGTPAARVGDSIDGGTLFILQTPVGTADPVAVFYVAPGVTHDAEVIAFKLSAPYLAAALKFEVRLAGLITSGNERILF